MTSRRLGAIAAAVAIAGSGVVAVVLLGTDVSGSNRAASMDQPPASTSTTSISTTSISATSMSATGTTPPTTVVQRPAIATRRPARPATVPWPTIAPPGTYSASIDVLAPRHVAAPVSVVIPSLGVDGDVVRTGVNERAELNVPEDSRTLVWYQYGPSPGEPGSAVIAGHLDWDGVLGTFHQLARAPVGERVTVSYDDGSERAFTVTNVELVDKPAVAVNGTFARDGASVLRLVTCGGEFNDEAHSYYSNVVVTAEAA